MMSNILVDGLRRIGDRLTAIPGGILRALRVMGQTLFNERAAAVITAPVAHAALMPGPVAEINRAVIVSMNVRFCGSASLHRAHQSNGG